MPNAEVSTVVESILSAFKNGMDLFRKLRGKKKTRISKDSRFDPEESKIQDSLHRRPREIRDEYARSVTRFGQRFESGDTAAHNSLAHILLVLNTGLINLINHALHGDSKIKTVSRHSLYNLSETAAIDTLSALSELYGRLDSPQFSLSSRGNQHRSLEDSQDARDKNRAGSPKQDRPGPLPLLVRGGWVRSRSGSSSTVSVVTPKKKSRARPEKHQRSHSEPVIRKSDPPQSLLSPASHTVTSSPVTCDCQRQPAFVQTTNITPNRHAYVASPRRQPSMLIMPVEVFDSIHEERDKVEVPPLRPPKIPLHSRPQPAFPGAFDTTDCSGTSTTAAAPDAIPEYFASPRPARRPRPASMATIMTTSTKIGEIPEYKWPDRNLTAEEQHHRPLPYIIPPPLMAERARKRKGFRFWKRDDRREAVDVR